mmetsp:Transcript_11067/g.45145  ORF Transcript_11067/g.45145 Transcript_11067/m.45145 type:complete len:202 (-) Transcript_11067:970-1575(-)
MSRVAAEEPPEPSMKSERELSLSLSFLFPSNRRTVAGSSIAATPLSTAFFAATSCAPVNGAHTMDTLEARAEVISACEQVDNTVVTSGIRWSATKAISSCNTTTTPAISFSASEILCSCPGTKRLTMTQLRSSCRMMAGRALATNSLPSNLLSRETKRQSLFLPVSSDTRAIAVSLLSANVSPWPLPMLGRESTSSKGSAS